MSDDTATTEPAVKETPQETSGTGTAAPESEANASGQDRAGSEQSQPEGGSEENNQNRRRGTSPFAEARQLRRQLREQEASFNSRFQELEARFEKNGGSRNGDENSKPRKTFWEAPEEVIDERFETKLTAMEERLAKRWETQQTVSQETSEWKQETSEATKLIQSHKGLQKEDIADIEDIVRSTPAMAQLRPLDRAKYALYLWEQEKGIGDKSDLKNKASSVTGAPHTGGGKRQWTEPEMEREMRKFPNSGKMSEAQAKELDALTDEFKTAYKEGRVRK